MKDIKDMSLDELIETLIESRHASSVKAFAETDLRKEDIPALCEAFEAIKAAGDINAATDTAKAQAILLYAESSAFYFDRGFREGMATIAGYHRERLAAGGSDEDE